MAKRRDERPRASIDSAPGVLFGRIRENSVVILEDDETEEVDEASSDLIGASYTKDPLYDDVNIDVMEKITRKADRQQKLASAIVTRWGSHLHLDGSCIGHNILSYVTCYRADFW